jgi:hypothetical protein
MKMTKTPPGIQIIYINKDRKGGAAYSESDRQLAQQGAVDGGK